MRITKLKAGKVIDLIMDGPYDPTLADTARIYKYYAIDDNEGMLASRLETAYGWLAQEPVSTSIMGGVLYARNEVRKDENDLFCVHICYANETDQFFFEQYVYEDCETDITEYDLDDYMKSTLKGDVAEEIQEARGIDEELPF